VAVEHREPAVEALLGRHLGPRQLHGERHEVQGTHQAPHPEDRHRLVHRLLLVVLGHPEQPARHVRRALQVAGALLCHDLQALAGEAGRVRHVGSSALDVEQQLHRAHQAHLLQLAVRPRVAQRIGAVVHAFWPSLGVLEAGHGIEFAARQVEARAAAAEQRGQQRQGERRSAELRRRAAAINRRHSPLAGARASARRSRRSLPGSRTAAANPAPR
jgi:hypothetical protein